MNNLMAEAANLMFVGMGFVFLFLTLLVFVTSLLPRIAERFEPPAPVAAADPAPQGVAPAQQNDTELMAVISAAINKYRSRHKP